MSYKREDLKLPVPVSQRGVVESRFDRFIEEMGGSRIYLAIVYHPLEGSYTNTKHIAVYHLEDATLVARFPDLFDSDRCQIDHRDYVGVTVAGKSRSTSRISKKLKTLNFH